VTQLRVGLVGAGSMGSLHARTVASNESSQLVWVADPDTANAARLAERWGAKSIAEADLASVDAVVVAAPTEFHEKLGQAIIAAGKPLLMEKPLGSNLAQSKSLVDAAMAKGTPLMCGLLERFNPALRTAAEIVTNPVGMKSTRHSPYAPRIKTGVAWDLLIHDVDFCLRLFAEMPHAVTALTSRVNPNSADGAEDVVECSVRFSGDRLGSMSASRVAHTKTRAVTIFEIDRALEIDLLRQDITIYRHVDNRVGELGESSYLQQTIIEIPVVRHLGEPLAHQWQYFLNLVNGQVDVDAERASILPAHEVVARCLEAHGKA